MKILTKNTQNIMALSLFTMSLLAFNSEAIQTEAVISLSPKQCVALNQGNLCFADIEISWTVQEPGDYCLYSSQQEQPLQCWEVSLKGTFEREIMAKEDVEFYLKPKGTELILGTAKLEMAWVYKKNNRSHSRWRMF